AIGADGAALAPPRAARQQGGGRRLPMVPSLSFVPLATPTGMIFNPTTVFVISTDGRSAPVVGLWPGGRSRRRDHGDQGRSQQHHAGLDFESGDCHLSFVLVFHFSAFCF